MSQEIEVINKTTGEIVALEPTPKQVVDRAVVAAKTLDDLIKNNRTRPVTFNGKRYLEIHHWQTVGKFFNCTVATPDAEPCEIFGVQGAKAVANIIDEKTGNVVGSATGYCMRDEKNWAQKPWAQVAAMAQTRAASRALSNKFRYVAVLAGYEGAPAEEMQADDRPFIQTPQPKPAEEIPFGDGPDDPNVAKAEAVMGGEKRISQPQQKRLFAIWMSVKKDKEALRTLIKTKYGKDHTSELTVPEMKAILKECGHDD